MPKAAVIRHVYTKFEAIIEISSIGPISMAEFECLGKEELTGETAFGLFLRGTSSEGEDGGGEMKDIVGDEAAKYRVCVRSL